MLQQGGCFTYRLNCGEDHAGPFIPQAQMWTLIEVIFKSCVCYRFAGVTNTSSKNAVHVCDVTVRTALTLHVQMGVVPQVDVSI